MGRNDKSRTQHPRHFTKSQPTIIFILFPSCFFHFHNFHIITRLTASYFGPKTPFFGKHSKTATRDRVASNETSFFLFVIHSFQFRVKKVEFRNKLHCFRPQLFDNFLLFILSYPLVLELSTNKWKEMKPFQSNKYSNVENANKFRVDAIWDRNAPKYRVACMTLHVTKAAQYIGYTQLFVIGIFAISLVYSYTTTIIIEETSDGGHEWSINYYMTRYISSLLSALTLQLGLVLMMLHGIRTNRKSLLLPYISFAAIALFLAVFQITMDILVFIDSKTYSSSQNTASYILIHFIGILVHVWCMKVVCKCYSFFGDKNVAEAIGQQLQTTSVAFSVDFSRPPPYSRLPTDAQPLTQA